MGRTIQHATAAALWLFAALLSSTALAQPMTEKQEKPQNFVSLELYKPSFDSSFDHNNFAFETGTMFLSAGLPINDNLRIKAELPFAYCGMKQGPGSGGTVGNPYLGLEGHAKGSDIYLEIGARAPIAPNTDSSDARLNGAMVGLASEMVDREEAFLSDTVPVIASLSYRPRLESGLGFDLRMGPSLWIATKNDARDNTETYVLYSGRVLYRALEDKLELGAGMSGRWWMTSGSTEIGDQTMHQATFDISYALGDVRPGIVFRLPVDKSTRDIQEFNFGLNLGFNF